MDGVIDFDKGDVVQDCEEAIRAFISNPCPHTYQGAVNYVDFVLSYAGLEPEARGRIRAFCGKIPDLVAKVDPLRPSYAKEDLGAMLALLLKWSRAEIQ